MNSTTGGQKSPSREPSLSHVLRQQMITSPLIEWKNKKVQSSKNREKSEVIDENLFDVENSKRKKRREAMKTEVDLSAAVREKLVRVKVKSHHHDIKKLRKETEFLQKAALQDGSMFPKKVDESYPEPLEPEGIDVPTKLSVSSGGRSSEAKQSITSNNHSLKLITFNTWSKEHSIFGTHYTNPLKSSEASRGSRSRFESMRQFNDHQMIQQNSENSNHVVGISSSATCRKCTGLNRQYSDIDLAQSTISMSMASFKTTATAEGSFHDDNSRKGSSLGKRVSNCAFPGFEPGEHCHSVAATILKRKINERQLSSSSSSDDVFQSTRYAREILEEKFRGIKMEKTKQETEETTPEKYQRSKSHTTKVFSKHQCKCKAHRHEKCVRGSSSKTKVSKKRSKISHLDKSQSQMDKNERNPVNVDKAQDSTHPNDLSVGKTSQSFERPPPCNAETCPSKSIEAAKEGVMKQNMNSEFGRSGEASDKGISCSTDCSGRPMVNPTSSAISLKLEGPEEDPCTSQTCLFSRSKEPLTKKRKQKHLSHSLHSRRKRSKKAICSYRTCKAPFGYPTNRFKRQKRSPSNRSSSKSGSAKSRPSKKSGRGEMQFICKCQDLYTGEKESSESDDIWLDAGVRHARNRRCKFNTLEQRKKAKCGGFSIEDAECCCYVCKVEGKPWAKYLKQRNTLIEIPYLLTPNTLKERANETSEIRKNLEETFHWSEEDLKNFCTKHYTCKKPDTRKALLKDNPYLMNLCDKNQKSTKAKPAEVGVEEQGRFGYFVDVLDDRLAVNETYGNLQALAERAVYCKWHQDIADMKVDHFLENMPKQQSCYSKPTHFDPDRRTCYNPKLIERLGDMVQFNMKPDRKIHEFSFPPKLLKYQEPQLVGDMRTDMPEIKILKEPGHFPTIYRDIFKTNKHDLRKLMDTLLPPLQWTDKIGFWEMKVSLEPDDVETNRNIISYLNENETLCHAINKKFCAGRYRLYFEVFAEVIRQELLDYPERAFLLSRIREEFLLTMLLYDGGLEMTLTSTTHLWKSVEAETEAENSRELEFLEKDISELRSEISEITALTYELEKRAEELADSRGYLHEDDVKLYKKTNHQLHAQFESIKAGFLYELD